MRAKVNIVLLICMLGLLLVPGRVFACHAAAEELKQEEAAEHACCLEKNMEAEDAGQGSCCADDKHTDEQSGDNADSCEKKCAEKSCRSSLQYNLLVSPVEEDAFSLLDADAIQHYAGYRQPIYTQGYFSIWQPPKII
ncbi:hypothetical protein HX021_09730 [Sphingobacterium sp. N143]|uniref:hypothetical protein n=1 Tax=Sphingobacterium sp. N143 TaxID=2746727 RepID=UPI0025781FB9|nr:hypothetical protein [Sphingobacterium sp. N143]MDM1294570.1 hypothetical protein [Sphingobacterium sp. N143]